MGHPTEQPIPCFLLIYKDLLYAITYFLGTILLYSILILYVLQTSCCNDSNTVLVILSKRLNGITKVLCCHNGRINSCLSQSLNSLLGTLLPV